MVKAFLFASAVMCGTILAANAVTYVPLQAPVAASNIVRIKSVGPPAECSEAAIQAACIKRPYASCSASYRRIHNC
jgi:hypothetical protein